MTVTALVERYDEARRLECAALDQFIEARQRLIDGFVELFNLDPAEKAIAVVLNGTRFHLSIEREKWVMRTEQLDPVADRIDAFA